jgi:LPXTG-motif cell wall-anchored protein
MNRTATIWARAGAAVAVTAALALAGTPAAAAEPLPDLFVSFDRDPVAEVDTSGTTIGMYVYNYGEAPATGVTVTLDVGDVEDAVEATVPEWTDQCARTGTVVRCTFGRLEAGEVLTVHPLSLASRQGAPSGEAGSVTVTIDGDQDDANPGDDTTSFPVTVIASGPDLAVAAADLNTANRRVGPGDTAPLYTGVMNEGDSPASDFTFSVDLPTGATFAEQYSDCTYTNYYPRAEGRPYVYGPSHVTCPVPLTLEPGEALLFFDRADSLFTITFGRNLAGPDERSGSVSAALAGEAEAARKAARAEGTGPSFAAALREQRAKVAKAGAGDRVSAFQELDESDNYADFRIFTKKNTLDVAVTAPAVRGEVGQTVDLTYEVVNHGPSDGGGPGVVITAPSGTVLLPAEWCYTDGTEHESQPESAVLRCNFESEFPTVASGYGRIRATVKLKIKSTPGTDGTIVARSCCVGSTESRPANNTARIVITSGTGGTGGAGGGLPVTGAAAGTLAAAGGAVLALGVVLLVLVRRRRVVLVTPRD